MFRPLSYLFLLLIPLTCVFGNMPGRPDPNLMPPRHDRIDGHSQYAVKKLERAQAILRTLVGDPDSYYLMLSNNPYFGAEAVPPGVYSMKPTVIIYEPSLNKNVTKEELAFMIAHELGHLNLYHMEKDAATMDRVMENHPIQLSGGTFQVFHQKLKEREADLFGYALYQRAGYDMSYFPRMFNFIKNNPGVDPHMKRKMGVELPTLSMQNPHFSMHERFELLAKKVQGLA